ncbi:hypothetical protein SAMN05421507_111187 [Lentzea jiangxiensis]|uniref:Uncharacterized protein n=1 Tax=Lentzea jiangxiensis TaxID=641025 RepID=A0A1H0U8B5_9PSEU|nr:hypothetical protein SAMN05421507_111187 [Lentzea jiangxiensis]
MTRGPKCPRTKWFAEVFPPLRAGRRSDGPPADFVPPRARKRSGASADVVAVWRRARDARAGDVRTAHRTPRSQIVPCGRSCRVAGEPRAGRRGPRRRAGRRRARRAGTRCWAGVHREVAASAVATSCAPRRGGRDPAGAGAPAARQHRTGSRGGRAQRGSGRARYSRGWAIARARSSPTTCRLAVDDDLESVMRPRGLPSRPHFDVHVVGGRPREAVFPRLRLRTGVVTGAGRSGCRTRSGSPSASASGANSSAGRPRRRDRKLDSRAWVRRGCCGVTGDRGGGRRRTPARDPAPRVCPAAAEQGLLRQVRSGPR